MRENIKKVAEMFANKLSKDIVTKYDYSSGVYKSIESARGSVENMIAHIGDETVEELFSRLFIPGVNGDLEVLKKANTLALRSSDTDFKDTSIMNALELFLYCCERNWIEVGILLANKVLIESGVGLFSIGYLDSSDIRRIILDRNYDFLSKNCIFCRFKNDTVVFRYKIAGSGLEGVYADESVSYHLLGIIAEC